MKSNLNLSDRKLKYPNCQQFINSGHILSTPLSYDSSIIGESTPKPRSITKHSIEYFLNICIAHFQMSCTNSLVRKYTCRTSYSILASTLTNMLSKPIFIFTQCANCLFNGSTNCFSVSKSPDAMVEVKKIGNSYSIQAHNWICLLFLYQV